MLPSTNFQSHSTAVVESSDIGSGTSIGSFSRIATFVHIGTSCTLGDHTGIETGARIGDRCHVGFGTCVGPSVTLEDDVTLGTHVSCGMPEQASAGVPARSATTIRRGASVGCNVTLLQGVTVGANAIVESGSVVNRNIPPNAIVSGNPASIIGYVTALRPSPQQTELPCLQLGVSVAGVTIHALPVIKDIRGTLSAGEFNRTLPFIAKRYFIVYDVSDQEVRGEHAHRKLHQFLVCVKGSVALVVDDGAHREEILLESPSIGVHVPPMVWATQYKYSRDAVLMVLASEAYDATDYIRDYDEYLVAVAAGQRDQ